MRIINTSISGKSSVLDFLPDVPFITDPGIEKEYMNGKTRMYLLKDGRKFFADVYDKTWKVIKGKIIPKRKEETKKVFKGISIDSRHII